jgi:hypothetical protein
MLCIASLILEIRRQMLFRTLDLRPKRIFEDTKTDVEEVVCVYRT